MYKLSDREILEDLLYMQSSLAERYSAAALRSMHAVIRNEMLGLMNEEHRLHAAVADEIEKEHEMLRIDFYQCTSLAYTRPLKVTYFEEDLHVDTSWTDVYIKLMRALYEDYSETIPIGKSFTGIGQIDFGNQIQAKSMTAPKRVYMGMYLETNLSATDIVSKIGALLDICRVDYENIGIYYEHKESKRRILNSSEPTVILTEKAKRTEHARNESEFYTYLHDSIKMADATCRSYTSTIRSAEKFASEHHLEYCRLYGCSAEETLMTAKALFENSEFLEYNAQQHNRFRAAGRVKLLWSFLLTNSNVF